MEERKTGDTLSREDAVLTHTVLEHPRPKTQDFPDGGIQAWLAVLGSFCGLFVSLGWTNCVGIFQSYYETHQLKGLSPSRISWIPSISMFTVFLLGPFVGRAFDHWGPRYLLLMGSFLHIFGLMMTSLAVKYYQFILAQAICSPVGQAMILYPSFACVATWFRTKRASAMGIVATGSSLGGVILPILVNRSLDSVGFEWSMRICAFVMFGMLIVVNLTVKSRLPPAPTSVGLMAFFQPFADPPFLLTALAAFFYSMGMFIPITFMVTYGTHVGMSPNLAGYLVSIFNGASGIGRVLPGFIADKAGNFNVSTSAACLSVISTFAIWLPGHSHATAILYATLFGMSSGSYTSITPALLAQISPITDIGLRSGVLYACTSIAALAGSPIGGALIQAAAGSYWKLQIFTGVTLTAGTAFYFSTKMYLARGKFWHKV
ncbi:hypothetical protein PV08_11829 [Exophiala spinifera]|uniref:Major facilitator superfamily (MFS) profile domain-containing protein n=1 Tax=Exophiala spinifera TaxID=91928 RepID=A0A0D2ATL6_9EURO|nr:uncharacterized protein PV08_11829 [Exophiala spinifera]KIW10053.1 hypothetical protein PV08_11829 [Exophiala spinifera]